MNVGSGGTAPPHKHPAIDSLARLISERTPNRAKSRCATGQSHDHVINDSTTLCFIQVSST